MRLLNCAFGELLEAVDEVEAVDDVLDSHANKSSSLEVDDVAELDVCSWAPPPPCTCPVFLESSSVDEVDAVDEVDDEFDVEDDNRSSSLELEAPGGGPGGNPGGGAPAPCVCDEPEEIPESAAPRSERNVSRSCERLPVELDEDEVPLVDEAAVEDEAPVVEDDVAVVEEEPDRSAITSLSSVCNSVSRLSSLEDDELLEVELLPELEDVLDDEINGGGGGSGIDDPLEDDCESAPLDKVELAPAALSCAR